MDEILKPATEWELKSMISALVERQIPIEIIGSGSKRGVGRPVSAPVALSMAGMRGISLYEPSELVMSARAGMPVSQLEAELAARGQMLPFEPVDLGPALGNGAGLQTIGAVFAANLSGARRVAGGSARDFLLGVSGVNGRGESFKAGGRVMKNVTGYDISRAITGSWGTLAVMSEVTFKVLPLPDDIVTLVFTGLTDDLATEMMSIALALPYEVSGATHLPQGLARRVRDEELKTERKALTAIRLENFTRSTTYRKGRLREALFAYGEPIELDIERSLAFWGDLRRLSVFPYGATYLWRISTTPKAAPQLVAAIKRHMAVEALYDWGGGLVWLETPPSADAGASDVRRAAATYGGHAMLVRADAAVRQIVEVFQPQLPAVEKLTRGIKAAFDPLGLFNPGRMYATM